MNKEGMSMNNEKTECVLGVDIGGTKIAAAILDGNAKIIKYIKLPTPDQPEKESLNLAISLITNTLTDLLNLIEIKRYKCLGIGIAAPGPTDSQNGILHYAPSLGWRNVHLRNLFERVFNLPVKVANDVQAAALGELYFGHGKVENYQNMFWMTISTGVGGSVIINRKLYSGNGMAGEVGHIKVEDDVRWNCTCGSIGCLESLVSGPFLVKRALTNFEGSPNNLIADLEVSPETIVLAAQKGDRYSIDLLDKTGNYIGKAISSVINLLDPDIVILGGGVILGARDLLMNPIIRSVRNNTFPRIAQNTLPPIEITKHSDKSGVIGAATLILQDLGHLLY